MSFQAVEYPEGVSSLGPPLETVRMLWWREYYEILSIRTLNRWPPRAELMHIFLVILVGLGAADRLLFYRDYGA
jgi:hypothetical protein